MKIFVVPVKGMITGNYREIEKLQGIRTREKKRTYGNINTWESRLKLSKEEGKDKINYPSFSCCFKRSSY